LHADHCRVPPWAIGSEAPDQVPLPVADLPEEGLQRGAAVLLAKPRHDIVEDAGDSVLGHTDGRTVMSGLDYRFTRAVVLQEGLAVALLLASGR
jgi:hypothetical protein